jgi:hypothetical protein
MSLSHTAFIESRPGGASATRQFQLVNDNRDGVTNEA